MQRTYNSRGSEHRGVVEVVDHIQLEVITLLSVSVLVRRERKTLSILCCP